MEDLRSYQQQLWDSSHASRGKGEEGIQLRYIPNSSGVILERLLPPSSRVLEVGCANGRDARFLAELGHDVVGIDFSPVALAQLREAADEQQLSQKILTIEWDINVGALPDFGKDAFDGFYARSALHVDDETMEKLAAQINRMVKPHGLIFIEGKGLNDPKIQRSRRVGNVAVDEEENNHLRRIWTLESCLALCEQFGWEIEQLEELQEEWQGTIASFIRLIARKN